jgi:YD repeat-containing protein
MGAVVTSSTDANGKTTSTSYTDPYFWRPYSSTDQLLNVTTYTYRPDHRRKCADLQRQQIRRGYEKYAGQFRQG